MRCKKTMIYTIVLCLMLSFFGGMTAYAEENDEPAAVLVWSKNVWPSPWDNWTNGFNNFMAVFTNKGIRVDNQVANTTDFPEDTDLTQYGLVVVWMPNSALSDTDIQVLQKYLDAGGRIYMQGENPTQSGNVNTHLSQAAAKMNASFTITADGSMNTSSVLETNSPLISNDGYVVSSIIPGYVSRINYEEPAVCVCKTSDGYPFIVDQPASKGRITVASDIDWMSPGGEGASHLTYNLYADSVANMEMVSEGDNPNDNFGEITYAVTFDANEGSGTMAKQIMVKETETALKKNAFTRTCYAFNGWNTKKDGSGTAYVDGANMSLTANVTLYAQWKVNHTPELRNKIEPTCTEAGYSGDSYCKECNTPLETGHSVTALDHEWKAPTYTWNEDFSECTAKRVCTRDASHVETETVKTEKKVTDKLSCLSDEKTEYTAVFKNVAFEKQTKTVVTVKTQGHTPEVKNAKDATCTEAGYSGDTACKNCGEKISSGKTIEPLGHDWDEVTYTWNEKTRECTATRVCRRNSKHIETETVKLTYKKETHPTDKDKTVMIAVAEFKNKDFTVQEKDVTDEFKVNSSENSADSKANDAENTENKKDTPGTGDVMNIGLACTVFIFSAALLCVLKRREKMN